MSGGKVPERIGRYVIDRLIGQGAMGAVYLGRDPELDRKVAIKTVRDLDLEARSKRGFLDRFRNEARAAARLSHPSIVGVFDVGEDEALGPFIVLEYVPGPTLKHLLRNRGPLAPAEIVSIAAQVASAIDVAHAAGIIHRDIKPDNILVTEDGRAKLADFGVARVPDAALTKEGQFLGTPCYAAPETLSAAKYSTRSDLFSFAAVIYELVAGVRAFPGDDAIAVAHAVVNESPPPPSEAGNRSIPKQLDLVVMKGLSKRPEDRYGTALELVEAVENAFVEAGTLEPTSSTQALGGGSSSRRTGWVFAAVLVAGTLLAVGAVAMLGPDSGGEPLPGAPADAGLREAETDASAALDAALVPITVDSGPLASPIDTGPQENDAGVEGMSRFEREEAAKDAIDRARELIEAGDLAAARSELENARALDPESSDLEEVEALLRDRSQ